MKNKYTRIIVVAAAAVSAMANSTRAQNFQNLDFEGSLGSPTSDNPAPFYNLPGWTVATSGSSEAAPGGVFYGGSPLIDGTSAFIALPSGFDSFNNTKGFATYGAQSLVLYVSGFGTPESISISQTGTIPGGQNSVSFQLGYFATLYASQPQNPLDYFSLSINNKNVPVVVTSINGPDLTVAGNISEWAGQRVTLSIANSLVVGESLGVVDDIAFSPQVAAVPEPSVTGLLTVAISFSAVFLIKRKVS